MQPVQQISSLKKLQMFFALGGCLIGWGIYKATFGPSFLDDSFSSAGGIIRWVLVFGYLLGVGHLSGAFAGRLYKDEQMPGVDEAFDALRWVGSAIFALSAITCVYQVLVYGRGVAFFNVGLFFGVLSVIIAPVDLNRSLALRLWVPTAVASVVVVLFARNLDSLLATAGIFVPAISASSRHLTRQLRSIIKMRFQQ